MHETQDQILNLQRKLDETYATAGDHLKSIHTEDRRLTAGELCEILSGVCVLDLATVSSDGAPFVAPVDGLFFQGQFWFCSVPTSLRFIHIRREPRVSAAHTRGESLSIIVHGIAHEVDTSKPGREALHDYSREVYGPSYDEWGYWGRYPFAYIEANKLFACRMPGEA